MGRASRRKGSVTYWMHKGFAVILVLISSVASADPADSIGLSWVGRASAGSCTAMSGNPAAAYYNPAEVVSLNQTGGFLGWVHTWSLLSPKTAHSSGGDFIEFGINVPLVEIGSGRSLWSGVAAMTPPDAFYEIRLYDEEEPVFLLASPRERRLSLSGALAAQLFPSIRLGVGFELLPIVDGIADLDLSGGKGANEFHVNVGYRLSPTAGVSVLLLKGLTLGLSYRGESHTEIDMPVEVQVGDFGFAAKVAAATYFVPHRLAGGLEWVLSAQLRLLADVAWYDYSSMPHATPVVSMHGPGDEAQEGAHPPSAGFADVVSLAFSIRYDGPLTFQAGYRFVPKALKEQGGRTNLLENDKHILALGFRVGLFSKFGRPTAAALTGDFSATWAPDSVYYKQEILPGNPGYPSVRFGGWRLAAGLGLEVEY